MKKNNHQPKTQTLKRFAPLALFVFSFSVFQFSAFAQETDTNDMTNVVVSMPINLPQAVVQRELVQSAQQIAQSQIRQATLAELESANTNLSLLDDSNLMVAKQIMLLKVRSTADLDRLNLLIASLPPPIIKTNSP